MMAMEDDGSSRQGITNGYVMGEGEWLTPLPARKCVALTLPAKAGRRGLLERCA